MRGLIFETYGAPENVVSLQPIKLGPRAKSQTLVKMLISSINPADILFVQGRYGIQAEFPQIGGLDGVGLVEESDTFKTGTLVAFRNPGTWGEYALVADTLLVPLPNHYPLEKASQLVLNAATAFGLLSSVALHRGDWIFLTAGSSMVARLVLQFAVQQGINVICTTRHPEDAENLKQLGARLVLSDHEYQSYAKHVQCESAEKGIAAAFDCIGGRLTSCLMKVMRNGGHYVFYGALDDKPFSLTSEDVLLKELTIKSFRFYKFLASLPDVDAFYQDVAQKLSCDDICVEIGKKFSLNEYHEALHSSNKGKNLFVFF